jgi:hypothetical protein
MRKWKQNWDEVFMCKVRREREKRERKDREKRGERERKNKMS